jgi:hypothetical protein
MTGGLSFPKAGAASLSPIGSGYLKTWSRMRRLRYQRPTLGIGLIMALAISTVIGMFAYYGVLVWRFFFD